MKKIISALLCMLLLCTAASAYYPDIYDPELDMMAETLSVAGIIDGVGDGTYNPGGYLTREQFAKVAVCILGEQEKAAASPAATAFTDVAADSWARGYIAYVAEKGVIAGFPDGSFGGGQVLTYAQAAMVLLRCLGYTDGEIGYHWPSDCVDKAAAIGLDKGLNLGADDPVTRGDAVRLIYNALFTRQNGSEDRLLSKTGLTYYENSVFYGVNKSDASLFETSDGSFKAAEGAVGLVGAEGSMGELFVNKDKEIVLFCGGEGPSREIIVASCLKNDARSVLEVSYQGGTVSIPFAGTVYLDGEKTTALEAAADITTGSTLRLYFDGEGRYLSSVLVSYQMEGPKTVTSDWNQIYTLFDISGQPTVIRKGVAAEISEISRFDVVYYSAANNTVYAYSDKVSGVYEKAAPLKSTVTNVTVSGKSYELGSAEAMNKLGENPGAFAIGDYITLLLDRDGKVADAIDASASGINDLGVLINTFVRINENGSQEYVAKIFLADGSIMEYTAADDYHRLNGSLVRFRFAGGKAVLSRITPVSEAGKINKENRTFGGHWLTSDCSILVLLSNPQVSGSSAVYSESSSTASDGTDGEGTGGDVLVRKIRLSDIEGSELRKDQVIHVEYVGEMQDVGLLFLKNVSNADYEYGLITRTGYKETSGGSRTTSGEYDVLIHGLTATIYAGRRSFTSQVIGINTIDSSDIVDAVILGTGKKVEAVSLERVKIDGTVYKADPNMDIYLLTDINEYSRISTDEAMNLGSGQITVYGDRSFNSGGIVKVIVIE